MSYDQHKPTLLYLSPTVPALADNGSAMRAGAFIELLAKKFNVQLLVVKHHSDRTFSDNAQFLQQWCTHVNMYPSESTTMDIVRHYKGLRLPPFAAIYVFRLCMVELALALMEGMPPMNTRILDLDDYESKKFSQLASYYIGLNRLANASQWQARARHQHQLEHLAVGHFARILLASHRDAEDFAVRFPDVNVQTAPNVIRLQPPSPESKHIQRSLLFVGSLQYYPNENAVYYLCESILPILRELYSEPLDVHVVGSRPSPALIDTCRRSNVFVHSDVESVRPFYEKAVAALVPLRLGGGTRMKILEALSFAVPVVTTKVGADGLHLEDGVHAMFADDPADFAKQCLRILMQDELAMQIANNGRKWVAANHSLDVLDAVLFPKLP